MLQLLSIICSYIPNTIDQLLLLVSIEVLNVVRRVSRVHSKRSFSIMCGNQFSKVNDFYKAQAEPTV